MDIWNESIVQLGSVGMMLAGLSFVSKYMFTYIMKALKEKEQENKSLETEFRQYLQTNEKEHLSIIKQHADIYKELIGVLENFKR